MLEYKWVYGEYTFNLQVNPYKETRFEGEGIIQRVVLSVNGYNLIDSTWGSEFILSKIKKDKEKLKTMTSELSDYDEETLILFSNDILYFKSDKFQENFHKMVGKEYDDFYDWFITSVSLEEGRRLKISKIREKLLNYVI